MTRIETTKQTIKQSSQYKPGVRVDVQVAAGADVASADDDLDDVDVAEVEAVLDVTAAVRVAAASIAPAVVVGRWLGGLAESLFDARWCNDDRFVDNLPAAVVVPFVVDDVVDIAVAVAEAVAEATAGIRTGGDERSSVRNSG
jgi:hypothetical protein